MELNPLVLVGGAVAAVAAYAFSEKKKTEDVLVAQALPVAAQQVQMGVPIQQAAQGAANAVVVQAAAKNVLQSVISRDFSWAQGSASSPWIVRYTQKIFAQKDQDKIRYAGFQSQADAEYWVKWALKGEIVGPAGISVMCGSVSYSDIQIGPRSAMLVSK